VTRHRACAAAWIAVALGPAALSADSSQSPAPVGSPSALARLATAVAAQVSNASPEPPLAVQVAAHSKDLARNFATLLISELALRKLGPIAVEAPDAVAAEMSARRSGARSLVRLSVALSDGAVQARGDLLSTWVNFWSGQSSTRSARPTAVILASVDADAQALALAAAAAERLPAGGLKFEAAKFADLPLWTAAVAAGDLDGDGRDEIVALTDDEIFAFSPEGRLLARRDHRILGDSPTPCREPFGAISIQSQRIAYFSAARRRGELLALDGAKGEFRRLGFLDDVPIAVQGQTQLWGSFVAGRSAFAADLWTGSGNRWSVARPFWALSLFAAPSGTRSLIAFADGTASLASGEGIPPGRPFRNVAAAMALIDIDGDGEPEIVTTSPQYRAQPDELLVLEPPLNPGAAAPLASAPGDAGTPDVRVLGERWRGPVRGGWAVQVSGARLGAGRAPQIVVGVWMPDGSGQLQVFRAVSP
jgi:hypothetical protein